MIDITIPIRTPTLNQLLRMHWRGRARVLKHVAWHIRALVVPPAEPLPRARVTIYRYTTGKLDPDGKDAIAKPILDALQPVSKRHPLGLGFIAGDGPDQIELAVFTVRSQAHATRIVIEAL